MIDDLVSIIMPAYNAEKYIEEAIESVLKQTYRNWELIITDDKSTDDTPKILDEYIRKDARIKVIYLKNNSGTAIARNTSIEYASGRYLAFLDSDDIWKPIKLEKQLKFMQRKDCAFSFTAYQYLQNKPEEKLRIIKIPKCLTYQESLRNTIIGCLTVIIDRKKTGYIKMPLVRAGQDHLTWWSILKRGFKAYGLQENLAEYRRTENSISHNRWKAIKRHWKLYREYEKIGVFRSSYYFICYAFNAVKKHYL